MWTADLDDLPCRHSFIRGIRRDRPAVTNALTLAYSSGAVEGNVCRIKALNARCSAASTSTCERGSCSADDSTQSHQFTTLGPECPIFRQSVSDGRWWADS